MQAQHKQRDGQERGKGGNGKVLCGRAQNEKERRVRGRQNNSSSTASATAAIRAPLFPSPFFMATVELSTYGCLRQREGGKESQEGRERTDGAA